jgi:Family of unknown function (DUF6452)
LGFGALTYLYSRIITMKKAIWFTFLAAIAISCLDNPDCFRLNNGEFGINFRVMGFGADTTTINNATISGTNIVVVSEVPSSIGLPLDPLADSLNYIFNWANDSTDFLSLGYTSQIQFVSADCGERHVFEGLTVLDHSFDSISVYSTKPTNPSSVNIQVFRCARPNFFGLKFKQRVTSTTSKDTAVAIQYIKPHFAKDSIAYDADTEVTTVYLPLDRAVDKAQYTFHFASGETRELNMNYTRQTRQWATHSCGTTVLFSAMKVVLTNSATDLIQDTTRYKFINKSTIDPAILNLETILN